MGYFTTLLLFGLVFWLFVGRVLTTRLYRNIRRSF